MILAITFNSGLLVLVSISLFVFGDSAFLGAGVLLIAFGSIAGGYRLVRPAPRDVSAFLDGPTGLVGIGAMFVLVYLATRFDTPWIFGLAFVVVPGAFATYAVLALMADKRKTLAESSEGHGSRK